MTVERLGWLLLQAPHYDRQSALDPAGPRAAAVETLWWFMFAVAAAVVVAIVAALVHGSFRHRGAAEDPAGPEMHRKMTRWVAASIGLTFVILVAFLVTNFALGRAVAAPPRGQPPLRIDVIGHQWWWEVRYHDPVPHNIVSTANEIHVPTGRPVLLRMTSNDVIHSFFAPNLFGKKDLIPGHTTQTWFQADKPGVYRGQCAEFCGHQHAKMGFFVVAEPPSQFNQWLGAQRNPGLPPADTLQARGQVVFMTGSCAMCHAITGTPAGGRRGPDLTHVGSRRTIAAGTLLNTRGNLGGWVIDPQRIKPGAYMPPNNLEPADLRALLAYLESLK
ncbi:MAG: cytochrome c oxidase subunit II [Gemmatimonadota bacterium]|nr:cytochrome c oxidase subunit II [Gemmatimonadota bacterium]